MNQSFAANQHPSDFHENLMFGATVHLREDIMDANGNARHRSSVAPQRVSYGVYLLHVLAAALALPLVKLAGFGSPDIIGLSVVVGGGLAWWISRRIVQRIYALNISGGTRTVILWTLPIVYFLIYMLVYYALASINR